MLYRFRVRMGFEQQRVFNTRRAHYLLNQFRSRSAIVSIDPLWSKTFDVEETARRQRVPAWPFLEVGAIVSYYKKI